MPRLRFYTAILYGVYVGQRSHAKRSRLNASAISSTRLSFPPPPLIREPGYEATPKHATASDDVSVNTSSVHSSPCKIETSEFHHDQQQDMQLAQNQAYVMTPTIPTVPNECYSTSHLPSPTHPRVHQQQDMQLTQNQAYTSHLSATQ